MPKTNPQIKFGTDGWRAIIADKFTFDNVAKVSEAVAVYLTDTKTKPKVAVGYDTRFLSAEFAAKTAEVLVSCGCDALLSNTFISTPALSCAVTDNRADLGIMISASHNPAYFNGFKIKTSDGCSAPESVTKAIEDNILSGRKAAKAAGNMKNIDFASPYLKRIASMIDFKLLNGDKLSVVADPMYGAGIGYIESLLQETPAEVLSIHSNPDPMFGGLHPEPIEINLGDLKKAVKETGADAGLATDGDADRIGVVDDKGNYYSPHQVFPLLLHYLCKYKKMKGKVVQTISLGYLSERIAKDYNLPFEEVPVGFKYIAEKIMSERILMGGEESGGYGYGNFLPERDGILNSMMIAEMLACTGKNLSELLREINKKYGTSKYIRTDFKNPGISKSDFVKILKSRAPAKIAGYGIREIKDYDGIEFVLEDDSWLLLRPSGTEPLIRVYCESPSLEQTKKIIARGHKLVESII